MSHVVLAAGSLSAITDLVRSELRPNAEWWVGILASDKVATLDYRDSREPLSRLVELLGTGALASIQMRRDRPTTLLIGIYRPGFGGDLLGLWTCVVEGQPEETVTFHAACLASDGTSVVSLSIDEAPEISCDVTVDSCPWDDWRLIRGPSVLRAASG